jgi:MFS family permease
MARSDEGNSSKESDVSALADVKQLGLAASIASLGYVFWIVGGMEMVERCAFYGVRAVSGLYANAAQSEGGLGIDEFKLGDIFMTWALLQSLLPVFTGGLSDRYGYKQTIFISTIVKIVGYLIMALVPSYWGFFTGAMVLAVGTAIFKPGIQGTLVNATTRENSSMAWGIFYQTVNIGGWIGPLIAAFLRERHGWHSVFYANSIIIALNFVLLLTYKEPKQELRLERARLAKESKVARRSLWRESLDELKKKHVWLYLLIFSGFWFMFQSLFDVLPLHIRDWVNTQQIVNDLFGPGGTRNPVFKFLIGMNKEGTSINPEGMLNLNAALIMVSCFFFAYLSGKLRATTSMVIGTFLATIAMFMSGYSSLGWFSFAAIMVFSVGEMLSSPKFSEFIGNFAPSDKKAMYLGFSQIPLAIGWTLEGKLGPMLYGVFASKERFAREMLEERGMPHATVAAIKQGEAFKTLVAYTKETPESLTSALHATHNVGAVWLIMAGIGVITAVSIWAYGNWIRSLTTKPN